MNQPNQTKAEAVKVAIVAAIRQSCEACSGTGVAGADNRGDAIECEYCGRPMRAITTEVINNALSSRPTIGPAAVDVGELVEALRFYARRDSWKGDYVGETEISLDDGQRARSALAKHERSGG